MISRTLLIGSRGQITLPKKLRDLFKTNTIVLELVDNQHAVISPVADVGGVISEFKKETNLSFEEIRNNAWIDSTEAREDKR
jgi:bifunctional DNA-binding transcriptional regulator/antitoxin component of YhaV-PrlF toxin-antitoxin module